MPRPHTPEYPPIDCSRRQFTALLALGSLGSLSACGGGGSSDGGTTPAPAPSPSPSPLGGSLSLIAGGLGGPGLQAGQGNAARLPDTLYGLALEKSGNALFRASTGSPSAPNWGTVTPQGQVSYFSSTVGGAAIVVDAQNRFVGGMLSVDTRAVIHRLQGQQWVALAGGGGNAMNAPLKDGQGFEASIGPFRSPVLGSHGSIFFLDYEQVTERTLLRRLDESGLVTTLLPMPTDVPPHARSILMPGANGSVRLVSENGDLSDIPMARTWHELVESAQGAPVWRTMAHRWPDTIGLPTAAAKGLPDTYWAESVASPARLVLQRLDGVEVQSRTWTEPRFFDIYGIRKIQVAAVDPVSGDLVVQFRGLPSLERINATTLALTPWCGQNAQSGQMDGQGTEARFGFGWGATEAFADASGELHVASTGTDGLTPLRKVTPQSLVTSQAFPKGVKQGLTRDSNGDWLTFDIDRGAERARIHRAPGDGSGDWQVWLGAGDSGTQWAHLTALHRDPQGMLWFSKGFLAETNIGWLTSGSNRITGGNVLGTISATGELTAVAGMFNDPHNSAKYPPLEQRPWYFDIADFGFESASVGWLLCNRPVFQGQWGYDHLVPTLVRVEGASIRQFTLPAVSGGSAPPVCTRLCVLPARPGEVFLAHRSAVFRWTEATGLVVLAGHPAYVTGVKLGALPAGLGEVKFLVPGPTAHSLYIGSENSVLRLDLTS